MNHTKLIVASIIFLSLSAQAKPKQLADIIAKSPPSTAKELKALMSDIHMVPVMDPETGKKVMRVTVIEKDSLWDIEGITAGDLVSIEHLDKFSKALASKKDSQNTVADRQ